MKLHLPKLLLSAVLAVCAASAARADIDELGINKGDSMYAADYAFSFVLDEAAVGSLKSGSSILLGAYWGNAGGNEQNSNGIVLTKADDGTYTLQIGQGMVSDVRANADLNSGSTYTFYESNNQTVATGLKAGVVYTIDTTGADGAMDPALRTIATGTTTDPDGTYAGNMNGSGWRNAFNNDVAFLISPSGDDGNVANSNNLVWSGTGDAAAWGTWNSISGAPGATADADSNIYFDATDSVSKTVNVSGAQTVNSISVYADYTFNATEQASITATNGIDLNGNQLTLSASESNTANNQLTGAMSNVGSLSVTSGNWELNGALAMSAGAATISNTGTLNLNSALNITDVIGLTVDGTYNDGANGTDNGILTGGYLVVAGGGTIEKGTDFALQLGGSTLDSSSYTISDEKLLLKSDNTTYWVNTSVTYDTTIAEGIATAINSASSVMVRADGTFYVTDASILSKTNLTADTSKVYFRASGGKTNLLQFTGDSGGAGLTLTAADSTVTTGTADSSYAGNITVLTGTTLKLGASGDSTSEAAVAGQLYSANKDRTITLQNGATLDIAGNGAYYHVVMEAGSKLTNTGGDISEGWKALPYLELTGDATIENDKRIVMQKMTNDTGTFSLALNGHTLTKAGTGTLYLKNVSIGNGTIKLNAGALETASDMTLQNLTMGGAATIKVSGGTFTVSNAKLDEHKLTKEGGNTLKITGGEQGIRNADITAGTLQLTGDDIISYGNDSAISVSGATLQLDARQSVDSGNSFTLKNANITGNGGTNSMMNNVAVGLEIYNDSELKISSSGTSTISTNMGFRSDDGAVKFEVTDGTLTNSGIIASHSSGTTGAVTKTGDGTLVLSGANTYTGGTTINGGTLKLGADNALGTGTVTVEAASLDINGYKLENATVTLKTGGQIINNNESVNIAQNEAQLKEIRLEGNATIGGSSDFGLLASGYNTTSINLQANTLTKTGENTFFLTKTSITGEGAIDVQQGTLQIGSSTDGGSSAKHVSSETATIKVSGGKLTQVNGTNLTIKNMEYSSGTVDNGGNTLTVTGTLTVKAPKVSTLSDGATMTIAGTGTTEIGTLKLEAGTTLSAKGSITLGTVSVSDYGSYFNAQELTTTLVSAGGITGWNGPIENTYIAGATKYTTTIAQVGDEIKLSFEAAASAVTGHVTSVDIYDSATEMLTLNYSGDLANASFALVTGISDEVMKNILGLDGLPEDGMVGITLKGTDNAKFTATGNQQIGFQGKDGKSVYWGSQVDGKWQYQAQYIPEPATATLSLLALAGLAARRRRK